ncbi:MAG: hypothetical protein P0Y60_16605 [Candidatus Microbacterium colombiense]|nr:MAG: hypothetical protein P0Y60_16605 [Microbacterium sp.]
MSDTALAPTPIARVTGIALGLAAVVTAIVLAFSWPAVTAEPRDVPLVIVGPAAAVDGIQTLLDEKADGLFAIDAVDDRADAVSAIEHREAVGAIVLGQKPELLTASAAGALGAPVAALAAPLQAAITAQAQAAAGPDAPPVVLTTTDVVPYAADDANGMLLSSAFFPLLLGGMLGGIAVSLLVTGPARRILGTVIYAIVGGVVLTSILQGWFGSIQGDFWLNASAFTLALAAIGAPIIGFFSLIGRAGIAVGPVVMMLFANPISGAALPAQFLPGGWGAVGQWFPPGAAATLVRDLSYFPSADATMPWLVLGCWAVGGLLLAALGHARAARRPVVTETVTPATSEPATV